MLAEFRATNFKSFRDEVVLSLVASSLNELPDNLFDGSALGKGRKILNGAIIYGPNASGKSNLIDAVAFVKEFVLNSAERSLGKKIPVKPFALDQESRHAASEFEVTFIHDEVRYQYGFVVDRERVHEEWLIAYPHGLPQTWFTRTHEANDSETEWYFGPNLKGEKSSIKDLTRPDVLYLSVAAQFNQEQLTQVYDWFRHELLVIPSSAHWLNLEGRSVRMIHDSEKIKQGMLKLLRMADVGIADLMTDDSPEAMERQFDTEMPPALRRVVQAMMDAAGEEGAEMSQLSISLVHATGLDETAGVLFGIDDESLGTRRMLTVGVPILIALQRGGVLVIDEVDSSLHPVLVRRIFEMFSNPATNKKGAQIIFNTHDVTLLDSSLVRRDQVWFTEKDLSGVSHLYSLHEFKPRKSEALEKNYLEGRYGAIPVLNSISERLLGNG